MTPNDETPLQEVLKLELDKYLDVLQEISSQASKEFALEKVRTSKRILLNVWKRVSVKQTIEQVHIDIDPEIDNASNDDEIDNVDDDDFFPGLRENEE